MPDELRESLIECFRARCEVCVEVGEKSLNGHLRRIQELHYARDSRVSAEPTEIENDK
jgi:hypothetical protein